MPLISDEYRKQQEKLHDGAKTPDGRSVIYGGMAAIYAPLVKNVIEQIKPLHILDYGCGKHMVLPKALHKLGLKHRFKYQAYDPAVPELAGAPVPADLVVCIDVLEHVEEDCIDDVLDHLHSLTDGFGLFTVDTGPAIKTLHDGRNAHILQRPPEWWLPRIMCRWELQTFQLTDRHKFFVIVRPRGVLEDESGRKLS